MLFDFLKTVRSITCVKRGTVMLFDFLKTVRSITCIYGYFRPKKLKGMTVPQVRRL